MTDDLPIEYELLKDAVILDLDVVETKIDQFMDNTHVRIVMRDTDTEEGSNLVESCAWGIIYALGVLSFADARPRGYSDIHFQEADDWTAGDMLRHLKFERGRLHFYADYVRGRMMKTTVEVFADGKIVLETVNRGESATRWVAKLQGKKLLTVLDGGPPAAGPEDRSPAS